MSDYNRVVLVGNLTRDPELSYTPSNTSVCSFGMAVNRRWGDRDGNIKDEVCYVDLTAFGKQGETISQYMNKGRSLLVEGRLRYQKWTNKEGQNRSKLDVVVENFTFLGGTGGGRGRQVSAPSASQSNPVPEDNGLPPADVDIPF